MIWFSLKSFNSPTTVPPILLEGTSLMNLSKQKYLKITIDSNLTWAYQVPNGLQENGNHIIIYYIPDCLCNFVMLFAFVYFLCCV